VRNGTTSSTGSSLESRERPRETVPLEGAGRAGSAGAVAAAAAGAAVPAPGGQAGGGAAGRLAQLAQELHERVLGVRGGVAVGARRGRHLVAEAGVGVVGAARGLAGEGARAPP